MKNYARFLLRHRLILSLSILALLGCSMWGLPHVKLDFSLIPILEANDEARQRVRRFQATFPELDVAFSCILEWPEPIGEDELRFMEGLAEELIRYPHITGIRTLATQKVIEPDATPPRIATLLPLDRGQTALERIERHPLLAGRLLSRDGRSAPMLFSIDIPVDDEGRYEITREIEERIRERVDSRVRVRAFGGAIVNEAMKSHMRRDMLRAVATESVIFFFLLPLLFRTWRGMVLPLATVNAAVLVNFGFMALMGMKITPLGVSIPGLIVIIALCDAIHMMHRFEEALLRNMSKFQAIEEMMTNVGRACFYTSFTTGLGFLSLLVARHAAVREFSIMAALGVLIAFATVITLLPLMLSFWPSPKPIHDRLENLEHIGYGNMPLTAGALGLFGVFCVVGIGGINVDSTWLGELPRHDPIVEDMRWYEANFNGLLDVEVQIDGALDRYETFRAIERMQEEMMAVQGVTGAQSYTQWVREMAGNPETMTEEKFNAGAALLRLAGEEFPRHLLTENFDEGRIIFQTRDIGTRGYFKIEEALRRCAARLPEGVHAVTAGYSRMAYQSSHLVVTTLLRSLLVSLAAISLFVAVSYRSARLGLMSAVVNILPILAALAVTGLAGIPLRIGIVMAFCVGVGLAVDDSIHFMMRFTQERRAHPGLPHRRHLMRTLHTTGKAIIITSVVLVIGALCYLPSSFQSIRDVGILLTVIVLVALAADLFLLPWMIEKFYPKDGA